MLSQKIYKKWMEKTQKEKIRKILKELKPAKIRGRVLDIGCGPGFLEELLCNKKIVAVDIDLENLKNVKGLKLLASGDALPFKPGSFQTIFCIDTIHLVRDPAEIERVLSKSGIAVASLPCSKYNQQEKIDFLRKLLRGLRIKKDFIAKTRQEHDAVVVAKK